MITSAFIAAAAVLPHPLDNTAFKRGDAGYPIDAWDLVAFDRSARRWLQGTPPTLKERATLGEMIRVLSLTPTKAAASYARRPATYVATSNECPTCSSTGPGRFCKSCSVERVQKTEIRPWNAKAKYCVAWAKHHENLHPRPVGDELWSRAATAANQLATEATTAAFALASQTQIRLEGIWHDDATGFDIPLRTVLNYAPETTSKYGNMLGSLSLTNDATRGTWERFAINRSAHVAAALKQDLWAAATGNPRPTHAWVLVERLEPYLVARRRSTPSVLEAGRLRLASIMARYCLAIRDNDWPSLDPEHADPDVAFSPVDYEPWMALPPDPHLHTSFEPGQEVVTE